MLIDDLRELDDKLLYFHEMTRAQREEIQALTDDLIKKVRTKKKENLEMMDFGDVLLADLRKVKVRFESIPFSLEVFEFLRKPRKEE